MVATGISPVTMGTKGEGTNPVRAGAVAQPIGRTRWLTKAPRGSDELRGLTLRPATAANGRRNEWVAGREQLQIACTSRGRTHITKLHTEVGRVLFPKYIFALAPPFEVEVNIDFPHPVVCVLLITCRM